MGSGSLAYQRMRIALLELVRRVPDGKIVEISTLAAATNIPARHAAYIWATLSEDEMDLLPWHRVIPSGGRFTAAAMQRPRTIQQIQLLLAEGHQFSGSDRIVFSCRSRWSPPDTHRHTFWADGG